MHQAETTAVDLAKLTHEILEAEMHQVGLIATQKDATLLTLAVNQSGIDVDREKTSEVYEELTHQFESMAHHYQGIFIADDHGEQITGALEGGREYKGINVADREYFKRVRQSNKGFAFLANEIKELAKQAVEASQDIKEKIEGIQGTTATTVSQTSEITRAITDVNDVVATIATAVEEQSAVTKEIANNVAPASTGIHEVNENVNQCLCFPEHFTCMVRTSHEGP